MDILLMFAGCGPVLFSSGSGRVCALEAWPGDGVDTSTWLSCSLLWLFRSFSDCWRLVRSAVRLFFVPFGRPIRLETLYMQLWSELRHP